MTGGTSQARDALAKANRVRLGKARVRRELKNGELTLTAALTEPRAVSLTVYELLVSQHYCGRVRAQKILDSAHLDKTELLGDLTPMERKDFTDAMITIGILN